jgi:hypothetical protein
VSATIDADSALDLSFTPDATGSATLILRATDSGSLFAQDTLVVTVTPENDPPVVVNAIPDTSVVENSGPVANYRDLNNVFNDIEDGSALAFAVQSNSNVGLVSAIIDADSALDLSFTPNVTGSATLILRATDAGILAVEDTFVVTVAPARIISGLVFEDADFSGTASDYDGGTVDLGLANVDVELYNAVGAYVTSTVTTVTGAFSFTGVMDGTYRVRARSATIGDADTPPKGATTSVPTVFPYPLAEMTWAGASALYGGQSGTLDDTSTPDNAGPGDTYVTVVVSGGDVTGLDLGFAYNLIVNTTDDTNPTNTRSRQGSLRQFIKNANGIRNTRVTTANSSQFHIPTSDPGYNTTGNGEYTIRPLAALPTISGVALIDTVVLDATTQPGYSGDPIIELDGSLAGAGVRGITISAGRSVVRGFVINRFTTHGIELTDRGRNVVGGNYIGTDVSGVLDRGNGQSGIRVVSSRNMIGGTTAASRNVISGNGSHGINIGLSETDNTIQGNYIGTDATGTAALGNSSAGIRLSAALNTTIGGSTPSARNVISGNLNGVDIDGGMDHVVLGNFIGTDLTGSVARGNVFTGVWVRGDASNLTIGGPGTGNVISGNGGDGIQLDDSVQAIVVQGNFLGTDASGTVALGNEDGIRIRDNCTGNTIGGTADGARNVISGNRVHGVQFEGANNEVQGNYIGTDASGTAALGNSQVGVLLRAGATGNTIGGTTAAARNVISANGHDGVAFADSGTTNNLVHGNLIGTDVTGTQPLGNLHRGVRFSYYSLNNTVGGTTPGSGNTIAYNSSGGVTLRTIALTGNRILGNSIFSHTPLGIDVAEDGVTSNDPGDTDGGPNGRQNYPVLTSAAVSATNITISGSLDSKASEAYRIEFFANAVANASDHGEGQIYLGYTTVTTDLGGHANFNETLPVTVSSGAFISSTATDSLGSTSEFSLNVPVKFVPTVVAAIPDTSVVEDSGPVANYRDLNNVFSDLEDGSVLTFAVQSNSNLGLVSATIDGDSALDLSFTPDAAGSATLILRATDSGSLFVEDTLIVTVTPENDAPVVVSAMPDTSVVEDSGPADNYRDLNNVFSDIEDGSALAFTVQSNSNAGLVNAMIDGDSALDLSFAPDAAGSATVILRATDSGSLFAEDTLVVTVATANDPPVVVNAIPDTLVVENSGPVANYRDLNNAFNDIEDGSALAFAVQSNSNAGLVSATIDGDSALDLSFAPDATGSATLIIRATDSGSLFAEDTLVITVATANDPPVVVNAIPDTLVVENSGPVANYRDLNVVFSDPQDGSVLAFAVQSNSNVGLVSATIDADSALDLSFASDTTGSATLIIRATDSGGLFVQDTLVVTVAGTVTGIDGSGIPSRFALHQNVPNPFNPTTVIRYDVPAGGGHVTLRLYDVTGRLIRTLANDYHTPGEGIVTWDGKDEGGNPVASGVYFYRLQAPGFASNRKMLLVR